MKRITIWISATLAIVALVIAYQLNAAGAGGKDGDDRQAPPPGVEASIAPNGGAAPDEEGKTGGTTDHTGKPGENK